MTSYNIGIMQCPECNGEFTTLLCASCNTIDARFFTDGFVSGPMYDPGDALLKCPICFNIIWLKDLDVKRSMRENEFFNSVEEEKLPMADNPRGNEYQIIMQKALWRTEEEEEYIRIRAWWSFNDQYRSVPYNDLSEFEKKLIIKEKKLGIKYDYKIKNKPFEISAAQVTNLEMLLQLIDPKESSSVIMRAEILRELGRFEECLEELKRRFEEKHLDVVQTIQALAEKRERRVEEIKQNATT